MQDTGHHGAGLDRHTMTANRPQEIVIIGLTESGMTFRPSDRAERLSGCMSVFDEDQRIRYSPFKPVVSEGIKCVVASHTLEDLDPVAFCFPMSLARDNELRVREGRAGIRVPRQPAPAPQHGEITA